MSSQIRIQGSFVRWTKLDNDKHDKRLPLGWFAVRSDWVPSDERPKLRGKWFKISCGKYYCYRALRMDPTLEGSLQSDTGEINIDWDGWLALHGNEKPHGEPLKLTMSPVNRLQFLLVGHKHPDPGVRVASVVASISLGLGLLALVIAVSQALM